MEAICKPKEHPYETSTKNLDNSGTFSFDEEVPHMQNTVFVILGDIQDFGR